MTAVINKKITFNGTTSYVEVLDSASLHIANSMTVCMRLIISKYDLNNIQVLFAKSALSTGLIIQNLNNSNTIVAIPDKVAETLVVNNAFEYNVIFHMVVTVSVGGNKIAYYKDGVLLTSGAVSQLSQNLANVRFFESSGGLLPLQGVMFEGQIYNRALSEAEINWNYLHPNNPVKLGCVCSLIQDSIDVPAGGTWQDRAMKTAVNNGSINNATTSKYPVVRKGANTLNFNGTTDYVNCGHGASLSLIGTLTLGAWIRNVPTGKVAGIIGKTNGDTITDLAYLLYTYNNTILGLIDDSAAINVTPSYNYINRKNSWIYAVVVVDANFVRLYIDGVEILPATARTLNPQTQAGWDVFVGRYGTTRQQGTIGPCFIYARALSATEVAYNFKHPNNPIKFGCVLNLTPESLYGTKWYDLSGNNNHGTITGAVAKSINDLDGR